GATVTGVQTCALPILQVNLKDLRMGGLIVADKAAFTERNLLKAGYPQNPLADDTLAPYRVLKLDITKLTEEAVKEFGVTAKEARSEERRVGKGEGKLS